MERGAIVGGRFEVLERNREGGMADIYCARDRSTGKLVAVKLLRGGDPENVARFEREARVLATLDHPAIVRYEAHGRTEHGNHYLVLEWLVGEDLSRRLHRGSLAIRESIRLVARIADGLALAHDAGIIHRDIKPGNIFLPEGRTTLAKLLDFGIARFTARPLNLPPIETDPSITLGSPGYMAPEQVETGKEVGTLADVYSLGCVFFRCLTGRPPFEGDSPIAIMVKTAVEEAPRVSEFREGIPTMLDQLVARMLAKDPRERPKSAASVADQLATILPVRSALRSEPATPSAITSGERRLISVVLAELSFESDSGVLRRACTEDGSAFLDELREIVPKFGGRLAQFADGTVVVTLEGRGAAKDQAAHAARCALAMCELLVEAPVALATGHGDVSQPLPVGEVIDRAAALLDAEIAGRARHEPGTEPGIRIDAVTAGFLDARFQIERDRRGQVLRSERIVEAARTLLGKPTTCVGRNRELEILEAILDRTTEDSAASAVLVTGEAGVGKSRLRYEFQRALRRRETPVETWIGRGDPVGAGSAFSLIAPAIRQTAGFRDGDPTQIRRGRLYDRLSRNLRGKSLERVSMFLGELAGVPPATRTDVQLRAARADAILMGDQMRRAWLDWLAAELGAQPVVLVLEDLHWGDRPSIRFVDEALRNFQDRPLMVLAIARPEVHELFPSLWAERPLTEIRLRELSRQASAQLAREVLGHEATDALVERIVERAEGNAFYLEELIRAVAEGRGDRLPGTLIAMMETRLEGLDAEARRLLRAASIFGKEFVSSGVEALLGGGAARAYQVERQLYDLAKAEVISRREDMGPAFASAPATPSRDADYTFRHELLREAAYASLTEEDRILGHRLAGEWLERSGRGDAIVLAEHFERGGEPARAVRWFLRAAEQALEGNDFEATIHRCDRGLACEAAKEEHGQFFVLQAQANRWQGNHAETQRSAKRAMQALAPGSAGWLLAAGLLATAAGNTGEVGELVSVGEELRKHTPAEADVAPHLFALSSAADRLMVLGRYELAEALVGKILSIREHPAASEPAVAGWIHRIRGFYALYLGDPATFAAEMTDAAESFDAAGDLRNACMQRGNAGYGYLHGGVYERAHKVLREALRTAERLGLDNVVTSVRVDLGLVLIRMGSIVRASEVLVRAANKCRRQHIPRLEGPARSYLATALALGGDVAGAEKEVRAAVELTAAHPTARAIALATLARILLQAGRTNEGLREANKAVAQLQAVGALTEGESLVRLTYAEALLAAGQRKAAKEAIEAARRRLLERAVSIRDDAFRAHFLRSEPSNVRTLELAWQLGKQTE